MLTPDVIAFVRASLPPPPLRILDVGAGHGELAADLRAAGYDERAVHWWWTHGEPVRGPYLHRWKLLASLGEVETELIARGRLPATGAPLVATRAG